MILKYKILLLIVFPLIVSCRNYKTQQEDAPRQNKREDLIETNRQMLELESKEIGEYISAHNLEMQRSGSGLRYKVTEEGTGAKPAEGNIVLINYFIATLNGDTIADVAPADSFRFQMGRAQVPKAIEEGVTMISPGGEIFGIAPSHLAYGQFGTSEVEGNTPIIFKAKLISIINEN